MKCTCCGKKIWFWQKALYVVKGIYCHKKCQVDVILNRKLNKHY